MGVPTWALIAGYDSVFVRMQILTALLSGVAGTLVFWAAVTLIYGRIYCSTVCPLGTFMDCVSAGSRLMRRSRRNYHYVPPSKRTRVVFLALAFISLLYMAASVHTRISPVAPAPLTSLMFFSPMSCPSLAAASKYTLSISVLDAQ